MAYVIGRGPRARETYPEPRFSASGGPTGPAGPAGSQGPTGPSGPTDVGFFKVTTEDTFFLTSGGFANLFNGISNVLDLTLVGTPLLSRSGGYVFYVGAPPRGAIVILTASFKPSANTDQPAVGLGIALNDDIVINSIFNPGLYGPVQTAAGVAVDALDVTPGGTASAPSITVTCQREMTLQNGDSISANAMKEVGDANLNITSLSMTIMLLPP